LIQLRTRYQQRVAASLPRVTPGALVGGPDAVAVRDGRVVALEFRGSSYRHGRAGRINVAAESGLADCPASDGKKEGALGGLGGAGAYVGERRISPPVEGE
jgi:hypothetical protein